MSNETKTRTGLAVSNFGGMTPSDVLAVVALMLGFVLIAVAAS